MITGSILEPPSDKHLQDLVREAPKLQDDFYEKKYDQGKLRYDLIPPEILEALAEIYTYGLNKGYGEESWKDVPDAKKRYTAAFYRHFQDYRKGNIIDSESTKSHLWHALWNIATLVWLEMKESKE